MAAQRVIRFTGDYSDLIRAGQLAAKLLQQGFDQVKVGVIDPSGQRQIVTFTQQAGQLGRTVQNVTAPAFNAFANAAKPINPLLQTMQVNMTNVSSAMNAATTAVNALTTGLLALGAGKFLSEATVLAAKVETLGTGLTIAAKNAGIAGSVIGEQEEKLKKLGITTQETRNNLAVLIASEIDISKAGQLARVAQDLAAGSFLNSSQAMETLTGAIANQFPILLRQFGIVTHLDQIYDRYKARLNIVGRELTEFERKQALTNFVLEEGARRAGTYETAMETAGKQLTSFARFQEEATRVIGEQMLPVLGAIIFPLNKALDLFAKAGPVVHGLTAAILTLTTALVAGSTAIIAYNFALQTLGITAKGAAGAVQLLTLAFNFVTKSPVLLTIGAIVTALAAASAAYQYFKNQAVEAAKEESKFATVASASIQTIKSLSQQTKLTVQDTEDLKKASERLEGIFPGLAGQIKAGTASVADLSHAYEVELAGINSRIASIKAEIKAREDSAVAAAQQQAKLGNLVDSEREHLVASAKASSGTLELREALKQLTADAGTTEQAIRNLSKTSEEQLGNILEKFRTETLSSAQSLAGPVRGAVLRINEQLRLVGKDLEVAGLLNPEKLAQLRRQAGQGDKQAAERLAKQEELIRAGELRRVQIVTQGEIEQAKARASFLGQFADLLGKQEQAFNESLAIQLRELKEWGADVGLTEEDVQKVRIEATKRAEAELARTREQFLRGNIEAAASAQQALATLSGDETKVTQIESQRRIDILEIETRERLRQISLITDPRVNREDLRTAAVKEAADRRVQIEAETTDRILQIARQQRETLLRLGEEIDKARNDAVQTFLTAFRTPEESSDFQFARMRQELERETAARIRALETVKDNKALYERQLTLIQRRESAERQKIDAEETAQRKRNQQEVLSSANSLIAKATASLAEQGIDVATVDQIKREITRLQTGFAQTIQQAQRGGAVDLKSLQEALQFAGSEQETINRRGGIGGLLQGGLGVGASQFRQGGVPTGGGLPPLGGEFTTNRQLEQMIENQLAREGKIVPGGAFTPGVAAGTGDQEATDQAVESLKALNASVKDLTAAMNSLTGQITAAERRPEGPTTATFHTGQGDVRRTGAGLATSEVPEVLPLPGQRGPLGMVVAEDLPDKLQGSFAKAKEVVAAGMQGLRDAVLEGKDDLVEPLTQDIVNRLADAFKSLRDRGFGR